MRDTNGFEDQGQVDNSDGSRKVHEPHGVSAGNELRHQLAEGKHDQGTRKTRLNKANEEPLRHITVGQIRVGSQLGAEKHHENDEELAPDKKALNI